MLPWEGLKVACGANYFTQQKLVLCLHFLIYLQQSIYSDLLYHVLLDIKIHPHTRFQPFKLAFVTHQQDHDLILPYQDVVK